MTTTLIHYFTIMSPLLIVGSICLALLVGKAIYDHRTYQAFLARARQRYLSNR